MPHSIFIETTIPSLYVSRPSRDIRQLAHQDLTRAWWDTRRQQFDLFTSQLVLDEAADGEPAKAAERVQLLAGLPLLDLNESVEALAQKLVASGILPILAGRDAFHIAAAGGSPDGFSAHLELQAHCQSLHCGSAARLFFGSRVPSSRDLHP